MDKYDGSRSGDLYDVGYRVELIKIIKEWLRRSVKNFCTLCYDNVYKATTRGFFQQNT